MHKYMHFYIHTFILTHMHTDIIHANVSTINAPVISHSFHYTEPVATEAFLPGTVPPDGATPAALEEAVRRALSGRRAGQTVALLGTDPRAARQGSRHQDMPRKCVNSYDNNLGLAQRSLYIHVSILVPPKKRMPGGHLNMIHFVGPCRAKLVEPRGAEMKRGAGTLEVSLRYWCPPFWKECAWKEASCLDLLGAFRWPFCLSERPLHLSSGSNTFSSSSILLFGSMCAHQYLNIFECYT